MTKVDAITNVLIDNGGIATWAIIYNQAERYYPNIKTQKDWKAGVRGVLYRELGKKFKIIDVGVIALIDYEETNLLLDEDKQIGDTVKNILTKVRIGQDRFRAELLKHLKICPITGIDERMILAASHIKPWSISSNFDRLNIYNGFIFSPTIDKLFDKGLITFENNKELIISNQLSAKNSTLIGIQSGRKYAKLPIDNRISYLEFHRENIFIQT
jgi:hypothetical protein